jgi:hypothetical protein
MEACPGCGVHTADSNITSVTESVTAVVIVFTDAETPQMGTNVTETKVTKTDS